MGIVGDQVIRLTRHSARQDVIIVRIIHYNGKHRFADGTSTQRLSRHAASQSPIPPSAASQSAKSEALDPCFWPFLLTPRASSFSTNSISNA